MGAGKYNITLEQGVGWTRNLMYYNAAKTAISLATYNARLKIKLKKDDTTAILTLTSNPAAGITIEPGAVTGKIAIVITATQTNGLSFESGVYDLEIYTALDAIVKRLLEGEVFFIRQVTTT